MKTGTTYSRGSLISVVAFAAALAFGSTNLAADDVVNVYTIGSNPAGNALDQGGNNIGGITSITWNHTWGGGLSALLTVQAEGVDGGPSAPNGGEHNQLFLNGVLLGELTQQGFYSSIFNLHPGPGNVPGITGISFSVFDVSAFVVPGVNVVRVDVDSSNWINEIEVSTLAAVPEPSTWVAGGALALMAGVVWRRRNG